jgi:predicted nucleic acid-binding protein
MAKQYKVYLDTCCLNRPFDAPEQERVLLEAEAILAIVQRCQNGKWSLVNSDALEFELEKISNSERAEQVTALLALAQTNLISSEAIENRAEVLINIGFKLYDALHIAFAEAAEADVMLTTDDRLLRRAFRFKSDLSVIVANPVTWLMDIVQTEQGENNDTN